MVILQRSTISLTVILSSGISPSICRKVSRITLRVYCCAIIHLAIRILLCHKYILSTAPAQEILFRALPFFTASRQRAPFKPFHAMLSAAISPIESPSPAGTISHTPLESDNASRLIALSAPS